jgi:multiple sugar transport system substrate-binding protein
MWYLGAEGLYYNKALVKTPPRTPSELVADALAAMRSDPKLKEGIAFEGNKYEGFVTVFIDFLRAFGGTLDPAHFDTPQNLAALQFLHDLVYKYKVVSTAAAGWQETQTDNAFQAGQAAFQTNWPYVQQEDFAKSSSFPLSGKNMVGFVPFPTTSGTGTATIAADALIVNAKSKHLAADEALLRYILMPRVQQARAITSGDAPSVSAAYAPALYSKAPYFRTDLKVFKVGYPRLVNAHYSQISADVQSMLSSVLANQESPAHALQATAAQIASIGS